MEKPKYCIYIRVSTKRQGASGLGLEAQKKMCMDLIEREGGECAAEFKDVESGTHRDRPGLWNAIDYCRLHNCTLVIAKLDRLARDVEFTFKVINSGIQIRFTDMPIMNTMILGVFASVAQYEREMCSGRTKAALGEIKDDIAKNGGHMSKSGRWIKTLGRGKGVDNRAANIASCQSKMRQAQEWKDQSPLYTMVSDELAHGATQKEILIKAERLYEKNPTVYCTREGKKLSWGILSRWAKEIHG